MTENPLTPAIFALLLALHDGERHGYALMADVSELTGGTVPLGPATLYRSLQRMRVEGLVEEAADGGAVARATAGRSGAGRTGSRPPDGPRRGPRRTGWPG